MNFRERIYSDYFMKNRYDEYDKLLNELLKQNFKFIKICDFYKFDSNEEKKVFLRHDIDNDVHIAKELFKLEKKHNIHSTYYFRWSTMEYKFIKELENYGNEIGYHYEEISTYAKKNHIKNKKQIYNNIDLLRNILIKNTKKFEKESGVKVQSICSHGDWINRKLNISNIELSNQIVKKSLNIKIEAYDIEKGLDFRISDRQFPDCWYPSTPFEYIRNRNNKIGLILVHPRRWNSSFLSRLREDIFRCIEELRYIFHI